MKKEWATPKDIVAINDFQQSFDKNIDTELGNAKIVISHKRKTKTKKSDHKHDYKLILTYYNFASNSYSISPNYICKICGKVSFSKNYSKIIWQQFSSIDEIKSFAKERYKDKYGDVEIMSKEDYSFLQENKK